MATRPEITGRKTGTDDAERKTGTDDKGDRDAFSIAEFCRRHSISVPLFYKLKAQGKGPETYYAGVRQLVSREAAAKWRRKREKDAPKEAAKEAAKRAEREARRKHEKEAAERAKREAAEA